jgi:hypothetical protein
MLNDVRIFVGIIEWSHVGERWHSLSGVRSKRGMNDASFFTFCAGLNCRPVRMKAGV